MFVLCGAFGHKKKMAEDWKMGLFYHIKRAIRKDGPLKFQGNSFHHIVEINRCRQYKNDIEKFEKSSEDWRHPVRVFNVIIGLWLGY